MARFNAQGLDGLIEDLNKLCGMQGESVDAVLRAGADVVKEAWKASAEKHGHRDTEAMIDSIGYKTPTDKGGTRTVEIYPLGKDSRGIRNAEKAFVLHYGTSKLKGSAWVDEAEAACENTVPEAMQAAWDRELEKKGLI